MLKYAKMVLLYINMCVEWKINANSSALFDKHMIKMVF